MCIGIFTTLLIEAEEEEKSFFINSCGLSLVFFFSIAVISAFWSGTEIKSQVLIWKGAAKEIV